MSGLFFTKAYAKAALLFSLGNVLTSPDIYQSRFANNHGLSYLIQINDDFKVHNFLGENASYFEINISLPQANNTGFIRSSTNINNNRCKILNYQLITPILKLRTINNGNDVLLEDIYNEGKNYDDEIFKEIVYSNILFSSVFQKYEKVLDSIEIAILLSRNSIIHKQTYIQEMYPNTRTYESEEGLGSLFNFIESSKATRKRDFSIIILIGKVEDLPSHTAAMILDHKNNSTYLMDFSGNVFHKCTKEKSIVPLFNVEEKVFGREKQIFCLNMFNFPLQVDGGCSYSIEEFVNVLNEKKKIDDIIMFLPVGKKVHVPFLNTGNIIEYPANEMNHTTFVPILKPEVFRDVYNNLTNLEDNIKEKFNNNFQIVYRNNCILFYEQLENFAKALMGYWEQ